MAKRVALDHVPDALGVLQGAALRRVDQQHRELVAAVAGDDREAPRVAHDDLRHFFERLVSGAVTEHVVDGLEVVDVEEHQRELLGEARMPLGLFLGAEREVPAIVDAGQRVLE